MPPGAGIPLLCVCATLPPEEVVVGKAGKGKNADDEDAAAHTSYAVHPVVPSWIMARRATPPSPPPPPRPPPLRRRHRRPPHTHLPAPCSLPRPPSPLHSRSKPIPSPRRSSTK